MYRTLNLIVPFAGISARDLPKVGGKGLNLGLLSQAGFPVPDGFVITTEAYARRDEPDVAAAILAEYERLGGSVAVRSSATAEDQAGASFAGQQETVLGVSDGPAVLEAVRECWASLRSERSTAYRHAHGIPDGSLGMAVVIQRMIHPEAAGVLFTCNPTHAGSTQILIEAAWGQGEAVVSGRITPDRWTLDRETGQVLAAEIAPKPVRLEHGVELPVPVARQWMPSLSSRELAELMELGLRVECFYGSPQDLEWAIVSGTAVLLQSRPITVNREERERLRREEISYLRERAEPGGTVWARYSLAEVLPEPLPMTWGLWKSFMSGGGGYGRMYRELGYDPDPSLEVDGVLDLIGGRPYFNLSRDVRLYFRNFPYDYPFSKLKANPELAIYPKPEANLARASRGFLFKLPGVIRQMLAAQKTLDRAMEALPEKLEQEVFPQLRRAAEQLRHQDLECLSDQELAASFAAVRRSVFDEYAPQGLKASVLAGLAIQELESSVKSATLDPEAGTNIDQLLTGVAPPLEHDLAHGLRRLSAREVSPQEFLADFGHRGPGEMELARPRWRELGTELILSGVSAGKSGSEAYTAAISPNQLEIGLGTPKLERLVRRARRLVALRESAKHHLMLGYEGIRLVLLELDRRYALHGGVFFLEPSEIALLVEGHDLSGWITERRRRRALALGLEAPRVLFSDDLEALGRVTEPIKSSQMVLGTGVSAGTAEGEALVLQTPDQAPDEAHDFILVCPSTDPGWVPLFLRARAVVLETGGLLSHGAIVARELALPAVANVADACTRIRTGQLLKVDGTAGKVWLL